MPKLPRDLCLNRALDAAVLKEGKLPDAIAERLPDDKQWRSFTGECPRRDCSVIGTLVCQGRKPMISSGHGMCAEFQKLLNQ